MKIPKFVLWLVIIANAVMFSYLMIYIGQSVRAFHSHFLYRRIDESHPAFTF